MSHEPCDKKYEDISIDDVFAFNHKFSSKDLDIFSKLSGDKNLLHLDYDFAVSKGFNSEVVFGMLSASLFSRLIGMHCPGKNALYLSQSMDFKRPLFLDNEITVKGTVLKKFDKFKMIKMKTEIIDEKNIYVTGEASAKFIIDEE
tara:strand:+ start:2462 stop:2896 length:435 start_codon:yes stop_codon:yes gene_type:complete